MILKMIQFHMLFCKGDHISVINHKGLGKEYDQNAKQQSSSASDGAVLLAVPAADRYQ